MIINSDLRQAIRSAINVLQEQNSSSRRQRGEQEAIKTLLGSARFKARVKAADRDLKMANLLAKRAGKFYESIGLYSSCNYITNHDKFVAAGGVIPPSAKVPRFDFVMAELAAATEKRGLTILKQLGVNWS